MNKQRKSADKMKTARNKSEKNQLKKIDKNIDRGKTSKMEEKTQKEKKHLIKQIKRK